MGVVDRRMSAGLVLACLIAAPLRDWLRDTGRAAPVACHEGNYGLRNILSGSRADEKAAAGAIGK